MKSSGNGKITLSFTDEGKSCHTPKESSNAYTFVLTFS